MNVVAVTLPKLAVLALYLRIFVGRAFKYTCYATTAVLCVACLINIFTLVFECHPRQKPWTPSLAGHCDDIQAHYRYASVPSILTDVMILILPIPMVLRLQTSKRNKIAMLMTFLFGSLFVLLFPSFGITLQLTNNRGLVTAILRFVTYFQVKFDQDATWKGVVYFMYAIIEPSIYLISACLLSCRSLVKYILHESRLFPGIGNALQRLIRSLGCVRRRHQHCVELDSVSDHPSDCPQLRETDGTHNALNGFKHTGSVEVSARSREV